MFNLLSPIIVLAGLLVVAIISCVIFALLKKFFFDGAPKNKTHRWVRRSFWFGVMPLCIFYALLFGFGLAESPYSGTVQVTGVTPSERLQSIAKIVSDSHKEFLDVAYRDIDGQPGFVVIINFPVANADAATQSKDVQEYENALATLLKLTATDVLPTEPSIQLIAFEVIIDGQTHIYLADAVELKAVSRDADDRTWRAKLHTLPPSSSSTPTSSP